MLEMSTMLILQYRIIKLRNGFRQAMYFYEFLFWVGVFLQETEVETSRCKVNQLRKRIKQKKKKNLVLPLTFTLSSEPRKSAA